MYGAITAVGYRKRPSRKPSHYWFSATFLKLLRQSIYHTLHFQGFRTNYVSTFTLVNERFKKKKKYPPPRPLHNFTCYPFA